MLRKNKNAFNVSHKSYLKPSLPTISFSSNPPNLACSLDLEAAANNNKISSGLGASLIDMVNVS